MLIQQFPDIHWLKQKIRSNFADQRGVDNTLLPSTGWPSIVLNTHTKKAERRDIKGPFSLFINLKGNSLVQADSKPFRVNEQCYALSNFGQHYDLLLDEQEATEIFNIHFGEVFYFEALCTLSQNDSALLDNPFECTVSPLHMTPRTVFRSPSFNAMIQDLRSGYQTGMERAVEEGLLFQLLSQVLFDNSREIRKIQGLPIKSTSVRSEMAKRLFLGRDYIHAHYKESFTLERLSQVSCLSKYHFLRLFKQAFGCTPYQYQKQLRITRGLELIQQSKLPLEEIALAIGMENGSSLSRMIFQTTGQYPSHYRYQE